MPKIPEYPNLAAPNNNDLIVIEDSLAANTKNISREDFLSGTPLPANTVDTQAIADASVTPAKRTGGYYAVNHTFGSGSGAQTITGIGFTPKHIEVTTSRLAAALVYSSGYAYYNGSSFVQGAHSITGTTANVATVDSTTQAFLNTSSAGGTDFAATVTGFSDGTITVNVTTANATANIRQFHIRVWG